MNMEKLKLGLEHKITLVFSCLHHLDINTKILHGVMVLEELLSENSMKRLLEEVDSVF